MTRPYLLLASVLALGACATTVATGPRAAAQLQSTSGNTAAGLITFTQIGDKVMVSGQVSGLKANAEHGFHVHEKGDCSSGDAISGDYTTQPTGNSGPRLACAVIARG